MKVFTGILHKKFFILLSAILLLTACQPEDRTALQENVSSAVAQTESPTAASPAMPSETELPEAASSALPSEAILPGAASPETVSQTLPSQDIGSGSAPSELQVHFIDVGQGDSTLIQCGDESMLIDAGNNDKGTTIQLYLQRQGVEELTYLIGTHPDADHIGGLDVIITKFDCGMVIMPDVASDTATYRDVVDAMEYRNYKNTLPQAGDIYTLGDAEFTIIAPNDDYTDDNNCSVGIKLVHGNTVFLFTGDAETEAEADILQNGIDLKADVLHVGHHGSDTSSSHDFISKVSPAYAVISCGTDNPYGHPHEQTLTTLKTYGVQVFRTDEQGSIIAVSDGNSISWNTEPSLTWKAGSSTEPAAPSPEIPAPEAASPRTPVPKTPSPETPAQETLTPEAIVPEAPIPEAIVPDTNAITYVLNHNTHKFHEPDCSSVKTIKESNREDTTLSREEILAAGFVPCKRCNP